jgi:hypothetical protein
MSSCQRCSALDNAADRDGKLIDTALRGLYECGKALFFAIEPKKSRFLLLLARRGESGRYGDRLSKVQTKLSPSAPAFTSAIRHTSTQAKQHIHQTNFSFRQKYNGHHISRRPFLVSVSATQLIEILRHRQPALDIRHPSRLSQSTQTKLTNVLTHLIQQSQFHHAESRKRNPQGHCQPHESQRPSKAQILLPNVLQAVS